MGQENEIELWRKDLQKAAWMNALLDSDGISRGGWFRTGPNGAVAVSVAEGVLIPEARVSIIGTVPQWDWHFVFEEAEAME